MTELAAYYVGACITMFAIGWAWGRIEQTVTKVADQL